MRKLFLAVTFVCLGLFSPSCKSTSNTQDLAPILERELYAPHIKPGDTRTKYFGDYHGNYVFLMIDMAGAGVYISGKPAVLGE